MRTMFQPMQLAAAPAPAWRPAAPAPIHHQPALARRAAPTLGQAASIAKGADVLFSLLTGAGAMTVGIAAMTVGIGGDPKTVPPTRPSSTWKWLGGITATLGAIMILVNVAKISHFSEREVASVTAP